MRVVNRFVSRCLLVDDYNYQRYYFICDSWLDHDIGDGLLDREFERATEAELNSIEHLFRLYAATYVCADVQRQH